MARVNSTTKETGNNFNVSNGTGAQVRAGINDILSALRTINSASGDPSGDANVVQFQPHIDSSTNLLKICTSVSSGTGTFTTIGNITQANLGLAPVAGATFTGDVVHNYTTALQIPVGTTAQRPGSPSTGDFRFNSTTSSAEIYNGSAFTAVGVVLELQGEVVTRYFLNRIKQLQLLTLYQLENTHIQLALQ